MISQPLSSELDRLRWLAACLVLLSHLRNLLFVEYGELTHPTIPIKLLYFITGFGHEAVVVFFVISGLLVGGVSIDKLRRKRFDPLDFAIHRFSRIYIVLVPALLACLLLDRLGLAYFNHAHLYTAATQASYYRVFADHSDWATALGNLGMQQHINVDVLGSDAPLWSLSYEWWYYTLFFLTAAGIAVARRPALRVLSCVAAALLLFWLPPEPALWLSIWLLGAAIGFSPLRRLPIPPLLAYAVFGAALLWSRFDHTYTAAPSMFVNFRRDAIVAASCFLLFTALNRRSTDGAERKFHHHMAQFSYTLYLVHVPFLVFAAALLNTLFGLPLYQQPSTAGALYFGCLLVAAYAYSYGFSRLTERHTSRLRRRLLGVARGFVQGFAQRRRVTAPAEAAITGARSADD